MPTFVDIAGYQSGLDWRGTSGLSPGFRNALSAAPATNNRLTGFGYDGAGNMISNGSAT